MKLAAAWLVLAGAFATAFVWFLWRATSRRMSLPCPAWLAWMVELDNPLARENRSARIVQHLAVAGGMKILDAGCGPGRLTLPLAIAVGSQGEVVALDLQRSMLDIVERKARARGLGNIRLAVGALDDGGLNPAYFDKAVLVAVLGEIPDQDAALKSLFGSLKLGGILSITETVFDPHYQNRATVVRLAEKAGFRVKDTFGNFLAFTMHLEKPAGPQAEAGAASFPNRDVR